jgi:putative endonuclease
LQSLVKPSMTYVGRTTKHPNQRLTEHNAGLSTFTKIYKPWKLIYYETFYCELCADKREQFLKSGKGYRLRKLIVKHESEL